MKKILFFFLIFAITAYSQTVQNVYVVRGDTKQLVFNYSGNIASTAITFIAKTGPNFIDPRIIQKKNTAAGGDDTQITAVYNAPYTTIRVFIDPEDTEDLSGYSFYYDITSVSTTIFRGDFKLWYDASTPYDGTLLPGSGVRITTVALDNGTIQDEMIAWDSALGRWQPSGDAFTSVQIQAIIDSLENVYQTKMFINVKDYGAVGDSVTDDTQAFQNAINAGDKIFVPEGVYTVDSLVLNSNTEFVGVGVGSKLCLQAGGTVLINIRGISGYLGMPLLGGVKVRDLWLSGMHEDAFLLSDNIGTRAGIKIDNAHNVYIQNCKITGFDLAGIISEKTDTATVPPEYTTTYTFDVHVSNCRIETSYHGIWVKEQSEYGFYDNNLIQGYVYGVKLIGGNNSFSNNQILNGYYGVWMGVGTNDSHGSFTGGAINHNIYALWFDSVRTTQNFTGLNIWYGSIKFNYSRGIRIMNSTIVNDSIFFTGGDCANSGFINCTFDDFIQLIDRDKGTDQSIMKNNNFFGTLTGLTDQEINDEEFIPSLMDISGLPTMEFNKIDSSFVTIANDDNLNFGTKDFTIEWFGYVAPNDSFQMLVDKTSTFPLTYVGYQLAISSDNVFYFSVRGKDETYASWGTSPKMTEGYYHVVATKQDTTISFYINGDSIDVFSRPLLTESTIYYEPTYSSTSNTEDLILGKYRYPLIAPTWYFNGGMNLVRLYNFAATSTQATSMFTNGQPQLSEVPYKYKWGSQDSLTSGTLELGKTYIIDNWITGDNFTNVGGANADSSIFIATGTTPTTWSNSSILRKLGCVVEYRAENSGVTTWEDNSDNGLDGTNVNVTPNYSTYIIALPDTAGITTGYVPKKQADGTVLWQPDISTAGLGTFNIDGIWIDTTAAGLATVTQAVKDSIALIKLKANTAWFAISPTLIDDSITVKMNRSEMTSYSTTSHTHIDFFDTLVVTWGVMDTTYAGALNGWKVPNDITITEISAYTDANTVTFNLEERAETTPNTAGTDVIGSDLVADTNQEETSTFTNATIAKNTWLVPTISATGDVSIFTISVRYIKTD